MSKILNLQNIGLPRDVLENNDLVELVGTPTGSDDEIIVLSQIRRAVTKAYVCHIANGYKHRRGDEAIPVVLDYPRLKKLRISNPRLDIHTFNGVKYTMACLADKETGTANWLW